MFTLYHHYSMNCRPTSGGLSIGWILPSREHASGYRRHPGKEYREGWSRLLLLKPDIKGDYDMKFTGRIQYVKSKAMLVTMQWRL